jgi:hypothetical protein
VSVALSAPFDAEPIPARVIVDLLAPALGWEKSAEVVRAAAERLGYGGGRDVAPAEANALLEELARAPGMVGVAARFARLRNDFTAPAPRSSGRRPVVVDRAAAPPPPSARVTLDEAPASGPGSWVRTLAVAEIVDILAHTIGQERSQDAVTSALRRLGLPPSHLDRRQAMALLDDLATEVGLVGITARFAKARAILRFGG